jgi:hypothetical protein
MKRTAFCSIVASALALSGCSAVPPSVAIYDNPLTGVWLTTDARARNGHNHPYAITADSIAKVLKGIQVEDRDTWTGFGILGSRDGRPAFSQAEMDRLVPHLIEALRKASPRDMATFYMVVRDDRQHRAITSGGLFVDEQRRLHLMLANWRSVPSGGQDYTMAMELDTRDEPLLPISPHRFRVGFHPAEAWIKNAEEPRAETFRAYNSVYGDPAKLVIVDLNRLM